MANTPPNSTPTVRRTDIWTIPFLILLPTGQVETLQVLNDLVPFTRQHTLGPPWRVLHDVEDWTAQAARDGLLRWSERDVILRNLWTQHYRS